MLASLTVLWRSTHQEFPEAHSFFQQTDSLTTQFSPKETLQLPCVVHSSLFLRSSEFRSVFFTKTVLKEQVCDEVKHRICPASGKDQPIAEPGPMKEAGEKGPLYPRPGAGAAGLQGRSRAGSCGESPSTP